MMDARTTHSITWSLGELIAALKEKHPDDIRVQAIPPTPNPNVSAKYANGLFTLDYHAGGARSAKPQGAV